MLPRAAADCILASILTLISIVRLVNRHLVSVP